MTQSTTATRLPMIGRGQSDLAEIHNSQLLRPVLEKNADWREQMRMLELLRDIKLPVIGSALPVHMLRDDIINAVHAGKAINSEELARMGADHLRLTEGRMIAKGALEAAIEGVYPELDATIRPASGAIFKHLGKSLDDTLRRLRVLRDNIGGIRRISDAETALANGLAAEYQTLLALHGTYKQIRRDQALLYAKVFQVDFDPAAAVFTDVIKVFPNWPVWAATGFLVTRTGGHQRWIAAPWPESHRGKKAIDPSREFIAWAVDADVELCLRDPQQLKTESERLNAAKHNRVDTDPSSELTDPGAFPIGHKGPTIFRSRETAGTIER